MYIVEAKEIPEHRPNRPNRSQDEIRQVMVGQFPLSYNLDTGEFALGGARLTGLQWISLRTEVDNFMVKHGLLSRLEIPVEGNALKLGVLELQAGDLKPEVDDFRLSLSKRAITVLRWLTRK